MNEDELLRNVTELCGWLGLPVHHCRPARTVTGWRTPIQGDRGFPDLVIVGADRVLYPELKSDSGSLDADQRMWRDRLRSAGAGWVLWRPRDWRDGTIPAVLTALAKGHTSVLDPYLVAGSAAPCVECAEVRRDG